MPECMVTTGQEMVREKISLRSRKSLGISLLCIGQIEVSTSLPGQPPGHLTFLKIIV